MPLVIPEETLRQMKMTEQEARIEIACRLYDADKLRKFAASQLAGLSRIEFENALLERGLPWIRLNWDETYEHEFAQLRREREEREREKQHRPQP